MFSATDLVFLAGAMAAAVVHIAAIALIWSLPGISPALRRGFTLFFIPPAWFCLVSGPSFAGLLPPRFMDLSQLVTGYTGAVLFVLSTRLLRPEREPARWEKWTLLGGLPATILAVSLITAPDPAALIAAYRGRRYVDFPLLTVMWVLHGAQLLGFVLATAVLFIRHWRRAADPTTRSRIRWAAAPLAAVAMATIVVVIIPALPVELDLARTGPLLTTPMALAAVGAAGHAAAEHRRLQRQREHMSRYLSREVVDRIASGRHQLTLGGELATATVLMADLRGFTSLSERLDPTEVVALLNHHFTAMSEVVFRHGGMIDKYIGDALLAVFGLVDQEADASRAVRCAVAMLRTVERDNGIRAGQGQPALRMGVGLARGPVVHGNIGSPTRMEYTVIGDTVNTASRVEALTKELGIPLLVTESVVHACDEACRFAQVATRTLRGRRNPTKLYTPRPFADARDTEPAARDAEAGGFDQETDAPAPAPGDRPPGR